MERFQDDTIEWFMSRAQALARLSTSVSDRKAVKAARVLEPLPQQTESDWEGYESQLTEVFIGTKYLEAVRACLILRATRMLAEDRERALTLAQAVHERVNHDHAELRDLARGAAALSASTTDVLAKATDPSAALREFFDNLRKRQTK